MDIITAASAGKSLMELGQEIAAAVKKATEAPQVTRQVLLLLDSVQAAVKALGLERQRIITDAAGCDLANPGQLAALCDRLHRYLHEDNVRSPLRDAIAGLYACLATIREKSQGAWWRKRDKVAAVEAFARTLDELASLLEGLGNNFYPGGSGMGVRTLVPIYEHVAGVRDDARFERAGRADVEFAHEELGRLVELAVRDKSHAEWSRTSSAVEALATELRLAFAVEAGMRQAGASSG